MKWLPFNDGISFTLLLLDELLFPSKCGTGGQFFFEIMAEKK